MINDWKSLKVGDEVIFHSVEFDGSFTERATVKEVHQDHLILECDDYNLWLDDGTQDLFYNLQSIGIIK